MSSKTYGTTDRTQGVLIYNITTNNDTTFIISLHSELQAKTYYHSGYRLETLVEGAVVNSGEGYAPSSYGTFTTFLSTSSSSKTYTKGKVSKTITIGSSYYGKNVSGWNPGSKSGNTSVEITIPAKTSYTVSYNANSGSGAPASQKKWYGEALTLSTTKPTRAGYTFVCWNTNSSGTGTDYNSGGKYTGNGNLTLYAKWKKTTYTVSYNANGGSGAPSSQTKTDGINLTLTSSVPTRTGYNFVKWNTKADGTGTDYAQGATYTRNASVVLYARWTRKTFTISYNANGGINAPSSQTKTYGTSITISGDAQHPTRTNYDFVNWNTKADGTGTKYSPGQTYSAESAITLYAQWKIAYASPTISGTSGKIPKVVRCDVNGTEDDEGACILVNANWKVDPALSGSKIYIYYRISGGTWSEQSPWKTTISISGTQTQGTISRVVGIVGGVGQVAEDEAYDVKIGIQDSIGRTTYFNTFISPSFFAIDVGEKGKSVGIGMAAKDNPPAGGLLSIGMKTEAKDITQNGNDVVDKSMLRKKLWEGSWFSGSITVPGASDYQLFVFRTRTADAAQDFTAIGFKVYGDIRLLGGRGQTNGSQHIVGIECSYDGDTFSDLVVSGITHTPSGNHGTSNTYGIYQIYGIC